jgi:triacylglycerol esterase/lipase EstA (alpha/beta hydrolase family)
VLEILLKQEPTALDTNFIEGQAKFLLKTIQFLLAKYKKYWTAVGKPTKGSPLGAHSFINCQFCLMSIFDAPFYSDTKIILIGYSMGGVVIKTAMLMSK